MRAGLGMLLLVGVAAGTQAQELDCLIEPKVTVSLGTPVEGVIDKVHVERGDTVEHDQVLIELESSVERASVEMARARADAEASLQRNVVMLRFAEQDQSLGKPAHGALGQERWIPGFKGLAHLSETDRIGQVGGEALDRFRVATVEPSHQE